MRLPISTKQSYWFIPELFDWKESGTVAQLLSCHVASQVPKEWMIRSLSVGRGVGSP